MFKKCGFYTLVRICGKVQAVKVFGYTDGKYLYYTTNAPCNIVTKVRGKNGWYCIHPETGTAFPVGACRSRKILHDLVNTNEMQFKLLEYMQKCGEFARRKYAEYVKQAEEGMIWKHETI